SVVRSASGPRAQMETLAPQSANASAIERPMPRLAPVTTTFLPEKESSISVLDAHFAEVRTFLEIGHGFLQLLESEHAVDGRLHLVLVERAQHRFEAVAVADGDALQPYLARHDEAKLRRHHAAR